MTQILGRWFYDIVTFTRQWCPICAKSRLMEVYDGETFCIGCGTIDALIKSEEVNEN